MKQRATLAVMVFWVPLLLSGCSGSPIASTGTAEIAPTLGRTTPPSTIPSPPSTQIAPHPATAQQATETSEPVQRGSERADLPAAPTTAFDPAGLRVGAGFVVLDDPGMVPAQEAWWLDDEDIVLGVHQNGEAQAFPIMQMAYHHIANTTVGGEPYLVTY